MQWHYQVDWRFLTFPDGEPGFSTAWLRPRSLAKQVEFREREYQDGVMARLAEEFGVTGVFASAGRNDIVGDSRAKTLHEEHNKEQRGEREWNDVLYSQHAAKVSLNGLSEQACRDAATILDQVCLFYRLDIVATLLYDPSDW